MSGTICLERSVRTAEMDADWRVIHRPAVSLLLVERDSPVGPDGIADLLEAAPSIIEVAGSPQEIGAALAEANLDLARDAAALAARFAELMEVTSVSARLEAVTGDHCRKFHADYVDIRLIAIYAGPGTEYLEQDGAAPARLPVGWIGLFKGRAHGEAHSPCLHRSPPIEGTGQRRLLLVIDTPRPCDDDCCSLQTEEPSRT